MLKLPAHCAARFRPYHLELRAYFAEVKGVFQEVHHVNVDDVEVGPFIVQRGAGLLSRSSSRPGRR